MLKGLLLTLTFTVAFATSTNAQNTNGSSTQEPAATTTATAPRPARASARNRTQAAEAANVKAVRDAFDTLVAGIRNADAAEVMGVYWNSPQLVLFNNNGTVTRSWEQVRSNRESLYKRVQDVKLDVSDVRIRMLGADGAVVTTLWKQSQTFDGKPESASGRLTLVFQKIGAQWKAVHAHTSPDRPDPSLLPASDRTTGDVSKQ